MVMSNGLPAVGCTASALADADVALGAPNFVGKAGKDALLKLSRARNRQRNPQMKMSALGEFKPLNHHRWQ